VDIRFNNHRIFREIIQRRWECLILGGRLNQGYRGGEKEKTPGKGGKIIVAFLVAITPAFVKKRMSARSTDERRAKKEEGGRDAGEEGRKKGRHFGGWLRVRSGREGGKNARAGLKVRGQ